MTTLVLCVDRGGTPADETPLVGADAVRSLVTDAGVEDPEDSRVNCYLEALRVARDLRSEGDEAVVALVASGGDGVNVDPLEGYYFWGTEGRVSYADDRIAVNALWPRTVIATAALAAGTDEVVGGPLQAVLGRSLEAVRAANRSTGRSARYVPHVTGTPAQMERRLALARSHGIDTVLYAPMLAGLPAAWEVPGKNFLSPSPSSCSSFMDRRAA